VNVKTIIWWYMPFLSGIYELTFGGTFIDSVKMEAAALPKHW
jgi:hypothetical protein